MKPTILIVDDEHGVASLIADCLRGQGYQTRHAASADAGIACLRSDNISLILLDINLPGINGLQTLELIKQDPNTRHLPVIMVTSHAEESLKVKGLRGGADDYIVKPFSLKELSARVESLLRRAYRSGDLNNVLASAGISMDLDRRLVTAGRSKVDLTPAEYELLGSLIRQKGRVLTYRVLAEGLSDGRRDTTSESIYQIVKNLRHKLGKPGDAIETVYGIGYRLSEE